MSAEMITEADIFDPEIHSPWVECEYGAAYCSGGAEAVWMRNDGTGWLCPTCWDTVQSEFADYMDCARYGI